MKIAFVLTQSLDSPSGLGRYGPLTRELVKLGHQVEVLTLHYDWANLPQKSYDEAGVQVHYVGQMHVQKSGSRKTYFSPGKLLQVSLNATAKLAQAVARSQADVIHLGKPQPFNVLAARYGRRGRPIFCDCDDYEAETNKFSSGWQKSIVRYFEDSIVRLADGLTVNTHFLQARYQSLGFPAEKIRLVPNGVERSRFNHSPTETNLHAKWNLDPNAPIILYMGTMGLLSHPVDLLLQAFVKVQTAVPEAQLLLVGGGEDYDKLKAMAQSFGVASNTVFTGRVPPEEIPNYLRLGAVSIDPVRDDLIAKARSPLKIVESLAVGTPVVTGDVGDRREVLQNGTLGLAVQPGSPDALAAGILTLLQNSAQRDKMAQVAYQQREQWFWDRLIHNFVKIYENNW
ncbi:glycosyltransferase family 4 protein [Candidatus Leptofilum sp.]|uniref:glycosyltransferase family 4 protein n=1 Tax=Candidatus Leptofilum sp. TaxID=3241576 RepID=UPI003B5C6540